jgi:hypothetical protein
VRCHKLGFVITICTNQNSQISCNITAASQGQKQRKRKTICQIPGPSMQILGQYHFHEATTASF